jgi:hypothetical protein
MEQELHLGRRWRTLQRQDDGGQAEQHGAEESASIPTTCAAPVLHHPSRKLL